MKFLLLHLIYSLFLGLSIAYLEGKENRKIEDAPSNRVGYLENVRVKVYGDKGVEWYIKGKRLYSIGPEVIMDRVEISSEEYEIRASKGNINRFTGRGFLEGKVEIRGDALLIKTERANIDLKAKRIYGGGDIQVWRYKNYVNGRNYDIFLSPLRVIIKEVRTKHDT